MYVGSGKHAAQQQNTAAGGGKLAVQQHAAARNKSFAAYVRAQFPLALTAEVRLSIWIPLEASDAALNEARLWHRTLPVALAITVS